LTGTNRCTPPLSYSEEEFRSRYSGDSYDKLKGEYDGAGRLLGLYDKCVRGR